MCEGATGRHVQHMVGGAASYMVLHSVCASPWLMVRTLGKFYGSWAERMGCRLGRAARMGRRKCICSPPTIARS